MTTPAAPVIGLTVHYYPAPSEGFGGRVLPGIITQIDVPAPDGVSLTIFLPDGATTARSRVLGARTWRDHQAGDCAAHRDFIAVEAGK